jgi:hypothetical protein
MENTLTKGALRSYLQGEFENDDIADNIISTIPDIIGPLMRKDKFIYTSDLQFYKDQIDWAATLNDVLVFTDQKVLDRMYNKYEHLFV